MSEITTLYRYSLHNYEEVFNPSIEFKEFKVIKETKCGYWFHAHGKYGPKKFTLKGDGKRFAHTTKELALQAFIYRRQFYQRLIVSRMAGNLKVISLAKEMQANPNFVEPVNF